MPRGSAEVPRDERMCPAELLASSHIQTEFTQLSSTGVAHDIAVTDVVSWIVESVGLSNQTLGTTKRQKSPHVDCPLRNICRSCAKYIDVDTQTTQR